MLTRDQLHDALSQFAAQRARFGDATETVVRVLEERLAALPVETTVVVAPRPKNEQRKQVTVLFAAIDGFTRLAGATHNTERLRQIDLLWRQLDETIFAHGGIVDKHMGDVVMGIFGVPAARENDPERAVRCAFALRELAGEALAALVGVSGRAEKGPELVMRIGINTGPVSLGQVGSDDGQTAIGDTVNVASRLKEATDEGGVYISQDTYRLVRHLFRVEPLGATMPYGLLRVDDPIARATVAKIERDLKGGGVHRYATDTYYGGGEWILLTAWLGWHYAAAGQPDQAAACLAWIERQADPNLDLAEQVHVNLIAPEKLPEWQARWGPVATPLLWSHAQYLILWKALQRDR